MEKEESLQSYKTVHLFSRYKQELTLTLWALLHSYKWLTHIDVSIVTNPAKCRKKFFFPQNQLITEM